eukprot:1136927-Pelagomonas_calceolata.AAC.5
MAQENVAVIYSHSLQFEKSVTAASASHCPFRGALLIHMDAAIPLCARQRVSFPPGDAPKCTKGLPIQPATVSQGRQRTWKYVLSC